MSSHDLLQGLFYYEQEAQNIIQAAQAEAQELKTKST